MCPAVFYPLEDSSQDGRLMKLRFPNLRNMQVDGTDGALPQTKSAPPLVALQFTDAGLNAVWSGRDFASLSREGYQKNAIVFRCVRLIAEAAASVPVCVRRGQICEDADPADILLKRGHPGASSTDVMEQFYGFTKVLAQRSQSGVLAADVRISLW